MKYQYNPIPPDREIFWIKSLKDQKPFKKGDITWLTSNYKPHVLGNILTISHPENNRYYKNYDDSFELCDNPEGGLNYEIY